MPRVFLALVLLVLTAACTQRPTKVHTLFDGRMEVALPEDYPIESQDDWSVRFVAYNGRAAFAARFPDQEISNGWVVEHDWRAVVTVLLYGLAPTEDASLWGTEAKKYGIFVPPDVSGPWLLQYTCDTLAGWVGKQYTFTSYDSGKGTGRCTARFRDEIVAGQTRLVDGYMLMVGGADLIELEALNEELSQDEFMAMSNTERWRVLRPAANADVAEQVLLSAKLVGSSEP